MSINKGQELVSFAVGAPGTFGALAHSFCQRLARWISEQPGEVPEATAMAEIFTELSTTVQRGNAQLLNIGFIVCRRRRVYAQLSDRGTCRAAGRAAATIDRVARDLTVAGGVVGAGLIPLDCLRSQPAEASA